MEQTKKNPKKGEEPISQEFSRRIIEYLSKEKISKEKFSKLLGLGHQTLSSALKGGNVARRTKIKIERHLSKYEKGEATIKRIDNQIPMPEVTGKEKPTIPEKMLDMIFLEFKLAADQVNSSLTTLANAGVGDRIAFRKLFKKEFEKLHTLTRALSSESMMVRVKQESGKTQLP